MGWAGKTLNRLRNLPQITKIPRVSDAPPDIDYKPQNEFSTLDYQLEKFLPTKKQLET